MRPFLLVRALVVLAGCASPALACPFCDGGQAGINEVRQAIFGPDFWGHLLALAAPFGIVLPIGLLLHGRALEPQSGSEEQRT